MKPPPKGRRRAGYLYTTNPAEKQRALSEGFRDETASAKPLYVFRRPVLHAGIRAIPLHRRYHPITGDHLLTVDPGEAVKVLRQGYTDENRLDALWVFPPRNPAAPDSVPLLRLWHPGTGRHLYTTDRTEADHAVQQLGYRAQRSGCHILRAPALAEGMVAVRLHRLFRP